MSKFKGIIPQSVLFRNKQYLKSGKWKCSKSPTGGHHNYIEGYIGTCKYCGEKKNYQDVDSKIMFTENTVG